MAQTAFEKVYERKWLFAGIFTLVYFLSLSALASFGLAPWSASFAPAVPGQQVQGTVEGEAPIGIEIPSIGVKANVANPNTTDIAALDNELTKGAVRYPDSALPGEQGNVLIFGHSSYLPVVHNQAYKAFNGIQDLKEGAPIYVVGTSKVFIYAVEKVEKANTSTGEISLEADGAKLTLATCDTFGAKSDRFIVTAKLVRVEDVRAN